VFLVPHKKEQQLKGKYRRKSLKLNRTRARDTKDALRSNMESVFQDPIQIRVTYHKRLFQMKCDKQKHRNTNKTTKVQRHGWRTFCRSRMAECRKGEFENLSYMHTHYSKLIFGMTV
jgi:hypothetical protein